MPSCPLLSSVMSFHGEHERMPSKYLEPQLSSPIRRLWLRRHAWGTDLESHHANVRQSTTGLSTGCPQRPKHGGHLDHTTALSHNTSTLFLAPSPFPYKLVREHLRLYVKSMRSREGSRAKGPKIRRAQPVIQSRSVISTMNPAPPLRKYSHFLQVTHF